MILLRIRTWDFGGQREYYATHQYFLSKRSLYLVVWKIPDGQKGISEIFHWLVNIQVGVMSWSLHFGQLLKSYNDVDVFEKKNYKGQNIYDAIKYQRNF